MERFILRKAAGVWWLLDGEQCSDKEPVPFVMNGTGAFLWKLLAQEMSQEQMAEMLCLEYEVDRAQALEDVRSFVRQFDRWNNRDNKETKR